MLRRVLALLLACRLCSASLTVVTNATDELYITTPVNGTTLGYTFLLEQNVLTVRINATEGSTRLPDATFAILPNYFLEYNKTYSIYKTNSVRSFLDFKSTSTDWGAGLRLSKRTEHVYQIQGLWTDPARKPLKFAINCYISDAVTQYQGIDLKPHEITMFSSILDFPFLLEQSELGINQLLLSGQSLKNSTKGSSILLTSDDASFLLLDTTAIVDGRNEQMSQTAIENATSSQILTSATKASDVLELKVAEIVLTFAKSHKAKNITFQQRLGYNTSSAARLSTSSQNDGNIITTMSDSVWVLMLCGILMITLASLP